MVVFLSTVLPLAAIIVPVNVYLFWRALPRAALLPPAERVGGKWARDDLAGYLFWLLGTLPLPVIVLTLLGPVNAAAFSIPFVVACALDAVSLNLGNVVTAEMSRNDGLIDRHVPSFAGWAWVATAGVGMVLLLAAPVVVGLFGHQVYRTAGTNIFRVLMLATLPRSILFLSLAAARAQARGSLILRAQAIASVGTVSAGLLLMPVMGAMGLAVGWLSASCVAAGLTLGALLRHPLGPVEVRS